MNEMTFPDFTDKIVAVELSSDPDIPFTVLSKPRFELQGGRVFLCGVVPRGVNDSDWCADAPVAIGWEQVVSYYLFESVDDLKEKTDDD